MIFIKCIVNSDIGTFHIIQVVIHIHTYEHQLFIFLSSNTER